MIDQPGQESNAPKESTVGAIVPSGHDDIALAHAVEPFGQGLVSGDAPSGRGPSTALSVSAMLRSKWLVLGIFLLVTGAAIPVIWLFMQPTYKAKAAVRVRPVVPVMMFQTEDTGMVPLYQSYLNTQVDIILRPIVLQRVLDRPQVQQTGWYDEQVRTVRTVLGGTPSTRLERLGEALSVRPRRGTELIDVSMTGLDPRDAQVIVNAVVDEYKKFTDEAIGEIDNQRFEKLTAERLRSQKAIEGLVATKFNLSKQVGAVDPEQLRSELATQLSVLTSQKDELRRELASARWELEQLGTPPDSDAASNPAGVADSEEATDDKLQLRQASDSEWRALNLRLESTRHELKVARQQYGESHPRIRQLLANVEYAERLLAERVDQLADQPPVVLPQGGAVSESAVVFRDRAMLEWVIPKQEQELQRLDEDIKDLSSKLGRAGDIAQQIAQLDEEIRQAREFYETIRVRLQELSMESKAFARISVARHAIAPSEPSRDRRMLLSAMAMGGATLLGLAVAYLRASTDPKIREAGDVQYTVRAPFLGQMPVLPARRSRSVDYGAASIESMRMVRTALLKRLIGTEDRVVLITSSASRAGKTSVAIELAASLAQLGKRTLLVEADLRRPAFSDRLGLAANAGLAALLTGDVSDSEVIVPGSVPRLDVLPAGKRPPDYNAELLANGVLTACLSRWKEKYEFVLLDSPPVLPVADARILAGQADGTILVLRASHCRRADVIQAYGDLSAAGGTLLGMVLVGARTGRGYSYQYDYDYRPEGAADTGTAHSGQS